MVRLIGYAGAILGSVVLVASVASFVALGRAERLTREYLTTRGVLDGWLLVTWILLVCGSVGLLAGASWAPLAVRAFLAMLVLWSLWYVGANLYTLRGLSPEVPVNWTSTVVGLMIPLVLVCALAVGVHLALSRASL
ncbi:MAG TPA: hypothetical protein VHG28_11220 [Longimicrobiaceae bacterium]|nr:hypothetical protein [Longimicrobiaceae bacterium]